MAIGDRLIELASVESTNKTAAELIALSKAPHGTVILAHEQTAGRGQRGRFWQNAADLDLAVSIILEPPHLRAEDQFSLSKLAALAVHDVVSALLPGRVRVKWPNDILVDRRKVAGILIECDLVGERVRNAIVGVGLNVNSTDLPEELAATSLRLETGEEHDRHALLKSFLEAFQSRYERWELDPTALDLDFSDTLWSRGRWAELLLDGEVISLRPMDVDRHGRLLVEHADGRVLAYGLDRLRFAPR